MIKNQNKVILLNFTSTVILQGLTFFSAPIFSRQLGTQNYGIVSVYVAWVSLASTIFTLQAGGTIAIARAYFKEDEQNLYQSSVLSLSLISYLCFSALTVMVLCLASRWMQSRPLMTALALCQGYGMYCVGFMNSKYIYEFHADKNVRLSILVSCLTIASSLALIPRFSPENNYWGRIIGLSASYTLIGGALCFRTLWRGKTFYKREYWAFTLPISIPTVFHLLAHNVLSQSDKIMLQSMLSNSVAGVYALANSFGMIVSTIHTSLNNSWVPFYYGYTERHETKEIKRHTKNYVELFTILAIGFILMQKEVFHIFAREDFWKGADYIPLFAMSHYFTFLYTFPVNYEFYHRQTKTIAMGTGLAAACNITLNYLFIRNFGGIGAVAATLFSHIFLFLFHYTNARKISADEFPFTFLELVRGVPFVVSAYILYLATPQWWLLRWFIAFALGIFLILRMLRRKAFF